MTAAHFWDRNARKYAKSRIANMDAYEAGLERVKHHLRLDDHVLELGCGTGATARRLSPFVAEYTATDISTEMVQIGIEAQIEEPIGNLTFRPAGDLAAALNSIQWDAILGFNLLHLLPDLDPNLREMQSALKPGGLLITKTPCMAKRFYLKPVIAVMQWIGKAPFVEFLNPADLRHRIEAAGFDIIEDGLYPPSVPSALFVARKR